jgi:DNA invertase Pin-like site-specific DNA recombinase
MKTVTKIEQPKAASRKRVAAYCRVSTDKDAQLESLENQMEAFRFRAAQRGDWDLVQIYADEGLSGTSVRGRVQFQQMIEDCKTGTIDYVITKSISRFARNMWIPSRLSGNAKLRVQLFFEKKGSITADSLS